MATRRVVVIPGEDAAPEAFHPTLHLIDRLGLPIEWIHAPVGREAMQTHGSFFPDEARELIDASDATLFGSTSGPSAQALFYLRWGRQTFANVRPSRWIPGYQTPLADPEGIDLAIVRENLEDMYVRVEGDLAELAPLDLTSATAHRSVHEMGPGRFALKVITERATENVVRFSFELARKRRERGHPGKLTCSTKYNMLPQSDGYFREIADRLAADYPDVTYESFIIDDFAHRLVARPHEFDVVVLPNLYGDVLSDAAAGLAGGLGLAPSGCYGVDYAYFESAHGTAPDIAGQGIINPTATILSAAMMLEYLEFTDAARAIEAAVERVYAEGAVLTPDQGGSAKTDAFCETVASHI